MIKVKENREGEENMYLLYNGEKYDKKEGRNNRSKEAGKEDREEVSLKIR